MKPSMKAHVEAPNSRLETFSVKLGGRWTTIRLERELMGALRDIAADMGIGVHELCTEIAVDRPEGSFTSALRVFIVEHYRRFTGAGPTRAPHPAMARRAIWARRDQYWVKRRTIAVGAHETAAELIGLYGWWKERIPAHGRVPAHENINPDLLRRLGLAGLVHTVDASLADPMNYRFRVFGRKVAQVGAHDFAGWRISELPGREYQVAAAEDYYTTVTTGVPRLQQIEASVGGARRVYQRLIVPFSRYGGKPDCLLVAVAYRSA